MVITIVMEAVMTSITEMARATEPARGEWVVEFNVAGCRFLRWAEKRRHLLLKPPALLTRRPESL